jgi:pyruvate/2-oxoglutarate dehydrogenase complex dihydrolipoamide acyltransferase (E2) component
MAIEVLLPKLGLTMQEGVIEEWLVEPGTKVVVGDAILRLATDKVDVDVEAEADGHLTPVAPVGSVLAPGTLIGWLLEAGEPVPGDGGSGGGGAGSGSGQAESLEVAAVAIETPLVAAAVDAATSPNGRLRTSPNARRVATDLGVDIARVTGTGPGGRIVSEDVELAAENNIAATSNVMATSVVAPETVPANLTPLVRKQARDAGIDLAAVRGTGPGGRIRRGDLDSAGEVVVPVTPSEQQTEQVIPMTGMRRAIANRMHASLHEMAQLTHGFEVDMTAVVQVRDQLKAESAGSNEPVPSLNDFIVRAAAVALIDHPGLNATIRDDGIHLLRDIHVGVAVAVPDGLVVPVVTHAARRSLLSLADETRALATAARAGQLSLSQLEGATFVVTSLGGYGVDFFTPIINPGNVAILGVGRLRDGVEWDGEVPRRTQVLTLSLTFDHRAVDGAPAASYLQTVAALLRKPLRLLSL